LSKRQALSDWPQKRYAPSRSEATVDEDDQQAENVPSNIVDYTSIPTPDLPTPAVLEEGYSRASRFSRRPRAGL